MLRALIGKEWVKIWRFWVLLALVNLGVAVQMAVATRRLFLLDHPEVVWYRVLQLGQVYCEQLRFLPLFTGILVALFQFLPEMQGGRLRLGLHLPITPQRLIFSYLGVGLLAFAAALLPAALLLAWVTLYWFPPFWPATLFFTVAPWGLAGVAGYLGTALVLLEPALRLKAANGLLAAAVCAWYLPQYTPGAWRQDIGFLVLPLLLLVFAVLYPAFRYRCRRVV